MRRHRAHRVEQHRQGPVEFFAAAREHDVLLAPLDQLARIADAMRAGGAGRADRIIDALDLVPGRKIGRAGGRHRLRHGERPDALGRRLRAVSAARRWFSPRPARAHDQAGALVDDVFFLEAGIAQRLFHRDEIIGRAIAHEAACARRSTSASRSILGCHAPGSGSPWSCNPSASLMPDFASRNEETTSCVLLPMDETMPMPVTTTRLMEIFLSSSRARRSCARTSRDYLRVRSGRRRRNLADALRRSVNRPTRKSLAS
jgi:hypothetical protein